MKERTKTMEQPPIPRKTSALVMNDMTIENLRGRGPVHNKLIEESGIIQNTAQFVAGLRTQSVPIFWVRVERRADRADAVDNITDEFLARGCKPLPPIVKGSYEALNVEELPVLPADQEILKPRYNPFIGTDLDIQLRTRGVNTVLLGGVSTNVGVENCARTARDLGYHVVVLSDCCFNIDIEAHEWTLKKIMPRFARVMTSKQALSLLA